MKTKTNSWLQLNSEQTKLTPNDDDDECVDVCGTLFSSRLGTYSVLLFKGRKTAQHSCAMRENRSRIRPLLSRSMLTATAAPV